MLMRWFNGGLATVLAMFAAVQYNDPDFVFWFSAYASGAAWCAVAALRPGWLRRSGVRVLLGVSLVLAAAGTVFFWPAETAFWRQAVWWDSESAREGMGVMILAGCLVFPLLTASRHREPT